MATEPQGPLSCPDCERKVVWEGSQFVCTECRWKEHQAMPPKKARPPPPKKDDDPKMAKRKK